MYKNAVLGVGLVPTAALSCALCCICYAASPLVLYFQYITHNGALTYVVLLVCRFGHINVFYLFFIFSKRLLKMLQQQFLYIVRQLMDVCWDINQSSFVSDIRQKLVQSSIVHINNEDIHIITEILTSQTTDSMTTELLADVEKCLSKCLALFRECLNMTNKVGENVTDDLQYMLACEKLKTYLSMAEVLLYDPISPVDYVMYHTVKHDCLQRVVSYEQSYFNTRARDYSDVQLS